MSIVDKLTPHPLLAETSAPAEDSRPPKEALTEVEVGLVSRSSLFIGEALRRHGVSLSGKELPWVAAEVADFVAGEIALTEKPETIAEVPTQKSETTQEAPKP